MHDAYPQDADTSVPHLRRDSSWLKPLRSPPPVGVGVAPHAAEGMGSKRLQKVGWVTCAVTGRLQPNGSLKLLARLDLGAHDGHACLSPPPSPAMAASAEGKGTMRAASSPRMMRERYKWHIVPGAPADSATVLGHHKSRILQRSTRDSDGAPECRAAAGPCLLLRRPPHDRSSCCAGPGGAP